MNFFTKFILYLKKPRLIVVTGKQSALTFEALFQVLRPHFRTAKIERLNFISVLKNKILILTPNLEKEISFPLKNFKKSIFVVTQVEEKQDIKPISDLINQLNKDSCLILNFDDETVRELEGKNDLFSITFGFQKNAKLLVSDFNSNGSSVNFKINLEGNSVPIWLENISEKQEIYPVLAAVGCAIILDINLVEISQSLKN